MRVLIRLVIRKIRGMWGRLAPRTFHSYDTEEGNHIYLYKA